MSQVYFAKMRQYYGQFGWIPALKLVQPGSCFTLFVAKDKAIWRLGLTDLLIWIASLSGAGF